MRYWDLWLATGAVAAVLAVVAVGWHQQHGPCKAVCEARGMRCRGTDFPPWGDDMRCWCVPGIGEWVTP